MFKRIKAAISGKVARDARYLADSDPKKALALLQTLAEAGDAEAMLDLAASYHFGSVCFRHKIPVNAAQAAFWYEKLKQKKNLLAYENLWNLYLQEGEMQKAADALKAAASVGIPTSMHFLALCYLHGQVSLRQNFSEGLTWMRKAAKTGYISSQTALADIYREGKLVEQDLVKAYMWYVIASAKEKSENQASYIKNLQIFQNRPDSFIFYDSLKANEPSPGKAELARNELACILSKDQILKAQQMAETCVSVNYNGFD